MIIRQRFDLDLEEIRPELAILRNATTEIKQSQRFKKVLQVMLLISVEIPTANMT